MSQTDSLYLIQFFHALLLCSSSLGHKYNKRRNSINKNDHSNNNCRNRHKSSGSAATVSLNSSSSSLASFSTSKTFPGFAQHPNQNQNQNHQQQQQPPTDRTRQAKLAKGSKKSLLQWDEENITLNAADMEHASPCMKFTSLKRVTVPLRRLASCRSRCNTVFRRHCFSSPQTWNRT